MIFSIAVHGGPASSSASHSAMKFAKASLAAGHAINRVFFYHDGVCIADALSVTPQDEDNLQDGWEELKEHYGIELNVCIAAALRRGVLNSEEAVRYERAGTSLHPAFEVVGLGQLIDAISTSDRFISFAT